MWAPARASLPGGGTVDVETSYPFGDTATVTARAPASPSPPPSQPNPHLHPHPEQVSAPAHTRVYLRVPSWASAATVNGAVAPSGEMWAGTTSAIDYKVAVFTIAFKPAPRLEQWDGGAVRACLGFGLGLVGRRRGERTPSARAACLLLVPEAGP